ncbi:hypothetical protein NDU88_001747 [Pleurodeles waltl]|uniref:Uncharacterized protein n=1 Tax=Pleurodeles waltl TaxID=8319 RepID=A0AAV7U8H9_PLEWA|nr:hypothetical protein NDU88_001747 [Pleurodeles waltl]
MCNGAPVTETPSAKQVAIATLKTGIGKCTRGTLERNDSAGRDDFLIMKERLGDDQEKRQRDDHGGRQEGEKQVDAISQGEDTRKMEEENKGENKAGKEPETTENPTRDTEAKRSDKEEESRGPRGSYHLGGGEEPSRKEDITKGPHHDPGGEWLYKVQRYMHDNCVNWGGLRGTRWK